MEKPISPLPLLEYLLGMVGWLDGFSFLVCPSHSWLLHQLGHHQLAHAPSKLALCTRDEPWCPEWLACGEGWMRASFRWDAWTPHLAWISSLQISTNIPRMNYFWCTCSTYHQFLGKEESMHTSWIALRLLRRYQFGTQSTSFSFSIQKTQGLKSLEYPA